MAILSAHGRARPRGDWLTAGIIALCVAVIALCLSPRPAAAQPVAPASPSDDLDAAVRAYQLGRREEARQRFAAIVLDPAPMDAAVRQEARIYLGELSFTDGDQEGARTLFAAVFNEDPAAQIDPFRHPPDVCLFFEYVRLSRPPPPKPVPPPLQVLARPPISAWAPFGAYQLGHNQRARGVAYAGGQALLLTTNIAMVSLLAKDHAFPVGDLDQERALNQTRLLGFAAGTSFYVLWATSILDAHGHWRRETLAPRSAP